MTVLVTIFCIALTCGAYGLSRLVGRRFPSPLTVPVFLSTPLVIFVLWITRIDLDGYAHAKSILGYFLGPATVALAVPLYRNRQVLVDHALPVVAGIVTGVAATMVGAIACAKALGLGRGVQAALSIKSVTAPVAIELAPKVHAQATVAAAFVIITGLVGSMIGPWLLTRFRVPYPIARGEALGTISHGQGTAQALVESELTGAAASIAMGVAAVATSLLAPVVVSALR